MHGLWISIRITVNLYEKDTKKEPQPTPNRASTEALSFSGASNDGAKSTFIPTFTGLPVWIGKHTGAYFRAAYRTKNP